MMHFSSYRFLLKDRCLRMRYVRADKKSKVDYSNGSAIIMFHHVAETKPEGVSDSCYSSVKSFRWLIEKLSETKIIVSLDTLVREIRSGVVPENHIVLTFDDVPADFYTNALPILNARQVPYTLFIATSMVDTDGYLTIAQLKELARDPLCTIGSHTVNHVKVREKGVNLEKELKESKETLAKMIGKGIKHFAFPFGTPFAVSTDQIRFVERSRLYESAVSTIPGYINKKSNKNLFFLPRIHSELFIKEYINSF